MSIKVYTDKELEKLSRKAMISVIKEYQSQPVVASIPKELEQVTVTSSQSNIYLDEILQDEHVRLYAKSYNNPFLGMEIKGGELYNRCTCDFILSSNILEFKVRYNTPANVLDGLKMTKISTLNITKEYFDEIRKKGLEGFVRDYFGFIDILANKNESPFSNYTFVG